ncbi:MAG: FRG domain-containing protein [Pseudomonadota bacterium]
MAIEEVRVRSWAHLNEVLFDEPVHPHIGRYRSNCAFRGVSDASYGLESTLMRLGGDFVRLEPHIVRSFQKYAHAEMHEESYIWNWLALAQHHGLPTRLLDWTYSPYVALNFVTDHTDKFHLDGAIWCVNFVRTNQHLSPVLKDSLSTASARVFTTRMLHEQMETLAAFDSHTADPFVLFIEPPSLDARIVNQSGLFSVMSDPALAMDRWFPEGEHICRKVIIPAEMKWEVRDKLDQSNINERVLFPGLDGLCTYLTRYYSPKI